MASTLWPIPVYVFLEPWSGKNYVFLDVAVPIQPKDITISMSLQSTQ